MTNPINHRQLVRNAAELIRNAQISPRMFFALFLVLDGAMRLADYIANLDGGLPFDNLPGLFVSFLVFLLSMVLAAGCRLYCLAICRGERAEYLTLFDGFGFAGRIILLHLLEYLIVGLWCMPSLMAILMCAALAGENALLVLPTILPLAAAPGIITLYRFRFGLYNLCEDPTISPMEALRRSSRQTFGSKRGLFLLDVSFMGWILLANLPSLLLLAMDYMNLLGVSMPAVPDAVAIGAQLLVPIAVGAVYLPRYYVANTLWYQAVRDRDPRPAGGSPLL